MEPMVTITLKEYNELLKKEEGISKEDVVRIAERVAKKCDGFGAPRIIPGDFDKLITWLSYPETTGI